MQNFQNKISEDPLIFAIFNLFINNDSGHRLLQIILLQNSIFSFQISDMALCIMDENEKISNMAKLFFTELSRKGIF